MVVEYYHGLKGCTRVFVVFGNGLSGFLVFKWERVSGVFGELFDTLESQVIGFGAILFQLEVIF